MPVRPALSSEREDDGSSQAGGSQINGGMEEHRSVDHDAASHSQSTKSGKKSGWKPASLGKWAKKKLGALQTKPAGLSGRVSQSPSPSLDSPQQQQQQQQQQQLGEQRENGQRYAGMGPGNHPASPFILQQQQQQQPAQEQGQGQALEPLSVPQQGMPSVPREGGSVWGGIGARPPLGAHTVVQEQQQQMPVGSSSLAASRYSQYEHSGSSSSAAAVSAAGRAHPVRSSHRFGSSTAEPSCVAPLGLQPHSRGSSSSGAAAGSRAAGGLPLGPLAQGLRASSQRMQQDRSQIVAAGDRQPVVAPHTAASSRHTSPHTLNRATHSPSRQVLAAHSPGPAAHQPPATTARTSPPRPLNPQLQPPHVQPLQPLMASAVTHGGVLHPQPPHKADLQPSLLPLPPASLPLKQPQQQQQQQQVPVPPLPAPAPNSGSHSSASSYASGFSTSVWEPVAPESSRISPTSPPHEPAAPVSQQDQELPSLLPAAADQQPSPSQLPIPTAFARHQPKISLSGFTDVLGGAHESPGAVRDGRARLSTSPYGTHHSRTSSRSSAGAAPSVLSGGFGSVQVPMGLESSMSREGEASLGGHAFEPSMLAAIGEEQQPPQPPPPNTSRPSAPQGPLQAGTYTSPFSHHQPATKPQPNGAQWLHFSPPPPPHSQPPPSIPPPSSLSLPQDPVSLPLPSILVSSPSQPASTSSVLASSPGHGAGLGAPKGSAGLAAAEAGGPSSGSPGGPKRVTFLDTLLPGGDRGPTRLSIPDELAEPSDRWSSSPLGGPGAVSGRSHRRVTSEVAAGGGLSPAGSPQEVPLRYSVAGDSAAAITKTLLKEGGGERRGLGQSVSMRSPRSGRLMSMAPLSGRLGGGAAGGVKASDEYQPMLPKPPPPPESLGHATRIRSERGMQAPGRLLSQVRLVQSIQAHDGVMWVLRVSADASMVATGGQDGVVRVWRVLQGGSHLSSPPNSSNSMADKMGQPADRKSGEPLEVGVEACTSSHCTEGAGYGPESMLEASKRGAFHEGIPVLDPLPIATFMGHKLDVLDISWSAGSFLLSASLDCTVRLWHVHVAAHGEQRLLPGQDEATPLAAMLMAEEQTVCMQGFPHPDLVTCVAFHPHSARRFATGCVDGKVRVWGVGPNEGRVLASAIIQHDMVTALAWSSDGTKLCAGTLHGKCRHYDWVPNTPTPTPSVLTASGLASISSGQLGMTHGPPSMHPSGARLDYVANIDVKDRRANINSPGRKVTGLVTVPNGGGLIVASDDSRLRFYHRYTLVCKYKGLKNKHTLLRPVVTEGGDYVLCGSDDGCVYIWDRLLQMEGPQRTNSMRSTPTSSVKQSGMRVFHKNPHFECFHTDEEQLTCVASMPPAAWRVRPEDAPGLLRQRLEQQYNAQMQPLSHGVSAQARRLTDTGSFMGLGASAQATASAASTAARHQAQAALHSPLLGALFLVGGFQGRLLVYENL